MAEGPHLDIGNRQLNDKEGSTPAGIADALQLNVIFWRLSTQNGSEALLIGQDVRIRLGRTQIFHGLPMSRFQARI